MAHRRSFGVPRGAQRRDLSRDRRADVVTQYIRYGHAENLIPVRSESALKSKNLNHRNRRGAALQKHCNHRSRKDRQKRIVP